MTAFVSLIDSLRLRLIPVLRLRSCYWAISHCVHSSQCSRERFFALLCSDISREYFLLFMSAFSGFLLGHLSSWGMFSDLSNSLSRQSPLFLARNHLFTAATGTGGYVWNRLFTVLPLFQVCVRTCNPFAAGAAAAEEFRFSVSGAGAERQYGTG